MLEAGCHYVAQAAGTITTDFSWQGGCLLEGHVHSSVVVRHSMYGSENASSVGFKVALITKLESIKLSANTDAIIFNMQNEFFF